jgi:trypsin
MIRCLCTQYPSLYKISPDAQISTAVPNTMCSCLLILLCLQCLACLPHPTQQPSPNIVGGADAAYGEFPNIVSLLHKPTIGFKSHFCGGSIYDQTTVITAAHCCRAHNPAMVSVLAGDYHRQGHTDQYEQEVHVAHMLVHEHYNDRDFSNDICLVLLSSPLSFNGYVGPISIPEPGQDEQEGTLCTVAGWGATVQGGSMANILQKVDVPVVDDQGSLDPLALH